MKSIEEVLSNDQRVWLSVDVDEKETFLQWVKGCGCRWTGGGEIEPKKDYCGPFMGIDRDLSIGYVSAMCYCLAQHGEARKLRFKDLKEE